MLFPSQCNFFSLIVFRLNSEWLALRTEFLKEISSLKPIHKIPHRTNTVLNGVVNFHGQLQLCVSLQYALELNPTSFV
ncbi:MAG: chemotaxis protein CheW, partial [Parachlamydiaceae bacterium]|nr:chemotaxis protein CheW [Parachlamydiaceae bacterium]